MKKWVQKLKQKHHGKVNQWIWFIGLYVASLSVVGLYNFLTRIVLGIHN